MDFTNLVDNGNILFEYLRANGYSTGYIFRIKGAYNYIIRHCDNSWTSYDDVLHDYHIGRCESGKTGRKSAINVIRNFDVEGVFPSNKANSNVDVLKTSYDRLNPSFATLVDKFDTLNRNAGLSYNTIHDKHLICSSVLYKLQLQGVTSLNDVSPQAMLNAFMRNGHMVSYRYKSVIMHFIQSSDLSDEDTIRLISYIPKIRANYKNQSYFTIDESIAIKDTIRNNTDLPLRNRAIAAMLFYTGLRCVDVANLQMHSVDFERERLTLIQRKTGSELTLPIRPSYGNLLYEYIYTCRPQSELGNVFISLNPPYHAINPKSIPARIIRTIYNAANIRMNLGDKRGAHMMRRHLIVSMMEQGVSRPVISAVVGHDSPTSLEPYLSADFQHLKECALDVSKFPISDEVFSQC